ncbi:adenine-specific methyltransferase EcoRI family protein [Bacteroides sp. ET336]|uniref:adenine-specific methyltransferase EcoRI family protein n=1 Tax=Bacteroides sp. ET336 TaxID=2972459 RepID=UPI0021AD3B67|nr:adenine-specific methyltransferase EcoRI family protein [Bacteroides sp. ET336]MCR8892550.1 adenine-specific methyltransferase EcoRI family protein [Bacteroides sp. ET336]MDN0057046.1 adenine-specific methyltransferase EcoRI family protein [Bacteroides caecigallinarum]
MTRQATNKHLRKAKKSKSDEFYTQLCDIERELQYYPDSFVNKVVYCNCDDSQTSNFFRFFKDNFQKLGLRKLIASCYKKTNQDLFEVKKNVKAYYCIYEGEKIPMQVISFKGDGDFRSAECIKLLKQADVVVTNPPFSLFREFVSQIVKYNKEFLIIGNVNAITYKEIFDLIQNNKIWLGVNLGRGISGFIVPEHYEQYGTEVRINENGQKIISTNGCLWLTNLELNQRHEDIVLTKMYYGNEKDYPKYDNCNGINVNRTQDIPKDYTGLMGVPITFLHKYNPAQFEIVKFRKGDDGKDLCINGKCPYFRILVKNKYLQQQQYEKSNNISLE